MLIFSITALMFIFYFIFNFFVGKSSWCMIGQDLLSYRYIFLHFVCREELERFVENGTLNHLKVCFSRAEPDSNDSEPKYVQHNLVLHAEHVTRILLKEDGFLYVCGWVRANSYRFVFPWLILGVFYFSCCLV